MKLFYLTLVALVAAIIITTGIAYSFVKDAVAWQALVAVGTLMAASVALFGDRLKILAFRPKLELSIPHEKGELTTITHRQLALVKDQANEEEEANSLPMLKHVVTGETQARFYHGYVSNPRREIPLERAAAYLLSVHKLIAGDVYEKQWTGKVPLKWRSEDQSFLMKTIGPGWYVDICHVTEEPALCLTPVIIPNNLPNKWTPEEMERGEINLCMTVVVQSDVVDSKRVYVRAAWDGKWDPAESEMDKHFKIKILPDCPYDPSSVPA